MNSILAQTFGDWEAIVCDSFSEDGSWECLQSFQSDPRINLQQVPRAGLYAGWNECLRRAKGDYIYIATSDDGMQADCIEKLLEPLESSAEVSIAVCNYQQIDETNRIVSKPLDPFSQFVQDHSRFPCIRSGFSEFLLHACAVTIWATMNSVLFRRALLEKIGFFRTDQKSFADVEWTLRASLASDIAVVPETLVTWRQYSGQATPKYMNPGDVRIFHEAVINVLNDPSSGIPANWKQIPLWKEKVSLASKETYLASYDLYRWVARRNPGKFICNGFRALRHEPRFVLDRLLSGFAMGEELQRDRVDLARSLMTEFGTEWPPNRRWK